MNALPSDREQDKSGTYFDYELKVWVRDGVILFCGHPAQAAYCCNATRFLGMSPADARHALRQDEIAKGAAK